MALRVMTISFRGNMETRRLVKISYIVAISLVLSYIETLLSAFVPLPGIKIGLGNTLVLFTLYTLGVKDSYIVTLMRVLLSSLLFGSPFSFLYSLVGGLFSLSIMVLLYKTKLFGIIAISTLGAVTHNCAQLVVAYLLLLSKSLIYYLPFLIVIGVISGVIVGFITRAFLKKIKGEVSYGT